MSTPEIEILVIEHDDAAAAVVQHALDTLETPPVHARRVEAFAQAPEALASEPIDLVIADLSVPSDEGSADANDVLRSLDVPVIVMVAERDRGIGIEAIRDGAQDYFVKERTDPDGLGRAIRYALDRHRLQRELAQLATTDELTGLRNRRGFTPLAEHHLKLADRAGVPIVLLFLTLDGRQEINEAYGHEAGSQLLVETAEVLRNATRDSDLAARLSGDAFCVLLTGDAAGAEAAVLSRVVEGLAVRNAAARRPYDLSVSIGSARYQPTSGRSLDELIDKAAARMAEQRPGDPDPSPQDQA
ncbi:MAG: diguanylate cyclase response regulator [Actinomycetota bacterium]